MLGKFYHRPPGGESWCDVILRLRSLLDTVSLHYAGCRLLVVTHQVVILCLRYLLEGLTEEQLLAIDRDGAVANCAVTEYAFDPGLGRARRHGAAAIQFHGADRRNRNPRHGRASCRSSRTMTGSVMR